MDWLILRLAREDGTEPVRVESIMACWIEGEAQDKTRGALVVFGPYNPLCPLAVLTDAVLERAAILHIVT